MHIHASVLDALIIFAMVTLVRQAWLWIASRYSDKPFGQAMAALAG